MFMVYARVFICSSLFASKILQNTKLATRMGSSSRVYTWLQSLVIWVLLTRSPRNLVIMPIDLKHMLRRMTSTMTKK